MKSINLSRNRVALVDDDDYNDLIQHRWYASGTGAYTKPVRTVRTASGYTEFPMVRALVSNLPSNARIRYRNGDRCDLQRANLILPEGRPAAPNSLKRGIVAELCVAADLFRQGFEVFLPAHGFSKWDMIAADDAGRLYRVQVKSGVARTGRLAVGLSSISSNAAGPTRRPLNIAQLDLLAIYETGSGAIAYMSAVEVGRRSSITFYVGSRLAAAARIPASQLPRAVRFTDEHADARVALSRNSPEATPGDPQQALVK